MVFPMKNHHYGFKHKGPDYKGRMHPGYDYNGPGGGNADEGMPLVACAPGVVTFVARGKNAGWGNMVIYRVDMDQFFIGFGLDRPDWCPERVWFKYAHCEEIYVEEGDQVDTGGQIATLGGTGGSWTAHLHWDLKKDANGPLYYPPKGISMEKFDSIYLDPERFIAAVNEHIVTENLKPEVEIGLIKYENAPEIYYFSGSKKHHIPDMYTLDTLFPGEEIQLVKKVVLKGIETGDPFPSIHP